jgi:hypothetical protein
MQLIATPKIRRGWLLYAVLIWFAGALRNDATLKRC